ncbi:glycoside hydrolase family 65 protein [Paenibacillus sp. Marseille-Q4541]|uniref:glycoside hydrolase family 65 protein n=1 Tax=Paenibacillus sp. Marseille-Q4541 TaxID=2831522 RepID=UPI001BAC2C76|nr:glycoside hydrolase family 65 protein [Paenibacillus sp. Marseille-Q4541]
MSLDSKNSFMLLEDTLDHESMKLNETLFALGNGHLGVRGNLEECDLNWEFADNVGTYVNGLYEQSPIQYGEWAYGYARNHQTICKLPSSHLIRFAIDGEWFSLGNGKTSNHKRILNLEKGLLTRTFEWESPQGKRVEARIERFVSFDFPELMLMSYQITPLNFEGEITIHHELKQVSKEKTASEDPRVANGHVEQITTCAMKLQELPFLRVTTRNSGLGLWSTAQVVVTEGNTILKHTNCEDKGIATDLTLSACSTEPIEVIVYSGYGEIFHNEMTETQNLEQLKEVMKKVQHLGYEKVKAMHVDYMSRFWSNCDVEIKGDDQLELGLHLNLFHLNQAAGRNGFTNIAAKGLTGDGYEGHYFWDTEMYMLPFFVFTQPEVAKQLLKYRHSILPHARKRARELGVPQGALFAWRTINGEECSAYYPAGTAQFHINADIAYGVKLYYEATGDEDFMQKYGLEILIETARFWIAFGDYIPQKNNQFCIQGVTGPDEYTAIVNNNYYTNLMAKENLLFARSMVMLQQKNSNLSEFFNMLGLDSIELDAWQKAADQMYLPYDEERQLTKQDDSFFDKAIWDFEGTPADKYPLLLHYHPLTIYRHQVNKQADTILAELLCGQHFTLEQKKRDYEYYEKITTHDSSLSRSIFGMMASEIGDADKAYRYFMDTALMDLTDMQKNTKDGIHAANMGGTWMSLAYGFAGMKVSDIGLSFSPRLPKQWDKLGFRILYKYLPIRIEMTHEGTTYELLDGAQLEINQNEETILLKRDVPVYIEN